MLGKLIDALNAGLMQVSPRYTVMLCKGRVSSYVENDVSQDARTLLSEAYMRFPKHTSKGILLHHEACGKHAVTRYSSPLRKAVIAWRIATFKRVHLKNDPEGAFHYATAAYNIARDHATFMLDEIVAEFPRLRQV